MTKPTPAEVYHAFEVLDRAEILGSLRFVKNGLPSRLSASEVETTLATGNDNLNLTFAVDSGIKATSKMNEIRKKRSTKKKYRRMTDTHIDKAIELHNGGMNYADIGRNLGFSGTVISNNIKAWTT